MSAFFSSCLHLHLASHLASFFKSNPNLFNPRFSCASDTSSPHHLSHPSYRARVLCCHTGLGRRESHTRTIITGILRVWAWCMHHYKKSEGLYRWGNAEKYFLKDAVWEVSKLFKLFWISFLRLNLLETLIEKHSQYS